MKIRLLIKSDVEKIRENANFNEEQKEVFEELINASHRTDAAICVRLCLSESKYYRIKKEIEHKIDRILKE